MIELYNDDCINVLNNLWGHIPPVYLDKGYFHATMEIECVDGNPTYELIFT